jgi:hypothetical protein
MPTPAATATPAPAASAADQTTLDRITALIQEGKLDDADRLLKELEGRMSMLPQSMQDKIRAARTALDAKKAASRIPGLGG